MGKSANTTASKEYRRYITSVMKAPMLEKEYEAELGRKWRDHADDSALNELVTSHIRLVVKMASGFKGYGMQISDLIQEGNIGLLTAAKRFDPEKGVRFSTYASWWILAAIQEYIVRNSSIVRIGSTPAQKSLFFNLRRLRAKIADYNGGLMTDQNRADIAERLNVSVSAVERMEGHFSGPTKSLNASAGPEDGDDLQDFLADDRPTPEEIVLDRHDSEIRSKWLEDALAILSPREQDIIQHRFLDDDKSTLAEIGADYGVTKERIRQIESRALNKLKTALVQQHGDADLLSQELLEN
ncbi:MAG: RNA polymerase factor sigma-32 [Rhodospirillaceae bacterium]|nr:RNA polymerase factor sigma-32 [Rhodospirillaceae bacterium]|tara:strand:+ start:6897 stop:7790 length:894 start_codon:yes stop_codon:yes gene_type:complete